MWSDVDDNHISTFTDAKPARTLANQGRFDLGTFYCKFLSHDRYANSLLFISAAGQIDAYFVKTKFTNEFASRYRWPYSFTPVCFAL